MMRDQREKLRRHARAAQDKKASDETGAQGRNPVNVIAGRFRDIVVAMDWTLVLSY